MMCLVSWRSVATASHEPTTGCAYNYYVVTYALPLTLFQAVVAAVTGLGVGLDCVRPLVLTDVAARAIIFVVIGPLICGTPVRIQLESLFLQVVADIAEHHKTVCPP